jgi:hypothetical protein
MENPCTIVECCDTAKKFVADGLGCRFTLCGPAGSKEAVWLDPSFGMFMVVGTDKFLTVKQLIGHNVWCRNVISIDKGTSERLCTRIKSGQLKQEKSE